MPLESPSEVTGMLADSVLTLRNIVLKFKCIALMPSASQATLGTFIQWKYGKAKTRTPVDEERFVYSQISVTSNGEGKTSLQCPTAVSG